MILLSIIEIAEMIDKDEYNDDDEKKNDNEKIKLISTAKKQDNSRVGIPSIRMLSHAYENFIDLSNRSLIRYFFLGHSCMYMAIQCLNMYLIFSQIDFFSHTNVASFLQE
jgi:hypothetical protein